MAAGLQFVTGVPVLATFRQGGNDVIAIDLSTSTPYYANPLTGAITAFAAGGGGGSVTVSNASGGITGAATSLVVPNAWLTSVAANVATMRVASVFTLTDAATIAIDASVASSFRVTLGGSRLLANPTNLTSGQIIPLRVIQDATGNRGLIFDTKYKFPSGLVPTPSSVAAAEDLYVFQYDATDDTLLLVSFSKGASSVKVIDAFSSNLWFAGGLSKILSTATQCIRVRRTSDSVEQDIGFQSDGGVDQAALTAFLVASSGTVKTVYDQSGNGNHLTQATTTKQPKIYTAGVYLGRISFDGVDDFYQTTNNWPGTNGATCFIRGTNNTLANTVPFYELGTNYGVTTPAFIGYWDNTSGRVFCGVSSGGTTAHNDFSITLTSCLLALKHDNGAATLPTQCELFLNGLAQPAISTAGTLRSTGFTGTVMYIAMRAGTTLPCALDLQTFVVYSTARSDADMTSISALL